MGECTKLLARGDESGNFDRTSEILCVASLVLRASPTLDALLEGMIRKALPHLLVPPHAAHLNHRAFHLVLWMLLGAKRRAEIPPGLAKHLADAERLLRTKRDLPELLRSPRRKPTIDELFACDQWLEREVRACWSHLGMAHAWVEQRILDLLRGVRQRMDGVLVAAVRMPIPKPATRSGAPPDAFLSLLALEFERLLLLLQGREPPVLIDLQVSERLVMSGARGAREMLTREHVMRLVDEVRALGVGAGVEVVMSHVPQPSDSYMPPSLMLADLAVNRLRWVLKHAKPKKWGEFLWWVDRHVGLPVELEVPGLGRLPTIAFAGAANEVIREVMAGRAAMGLNELAPLEREQTMRWVAALKARRPGEDG